MKTTPVQWMRRGRYRTSAAIAAASLALSTPAGCDSAPRSAPEAGGEPIVLQASDVRVLGTSSAIADVQDLEVHADGTVWVLNSVEPYVIGFGPDGSVIRTHGRRGGGPGEFGEPAGFVVGGVDGDVWVFDRRRHAIIQVSRPDAARPEIALPREEIPPGSVTGGLEVLGKAWTRTARLGSEIIVPRSAGQAESVSAIWRSAWGADLVALDPGTGAVRNVVSLGSVLGDPSAHFQLLESGFPPFPLWPRLWAVCTGREIRVYDRLRHEVRGFTRDGTELEASPLPPARQGGVTPRQFAQVTFGFRLIERAGGVPPGGRVQVSSADSARVLAGLLARVDAPPQQLADLLPRYVDFRCAEDGTLWLRLLGIETGGLSGGPVWLRITPAGETREVWFPDRFDPYRFRSERVWGVQRDELDVASVAWIASPRAG